MEGMPFRLSLTLLLGAVILSIAILQLNVFSQYSERKLFADDVTNVLQAMRSVSTSGDYGSFLRVRLRVPQGSSVVLDNSTQKVVVNFYGELKQYDPPGLILLYRQYLPADYQLVIYYGRPSNYSDPFVVAVG